MQAFQSRGACPARRLQRRACTVASAASATADGGAGAGQPAGVVISPIQRLVAFQQAFWKFLRPHTIRGTILGSMAVTARALIESPVVSAQTNPSQYSHQCTAGHLERPASCHLGGSLASQQCPTKRASDTAFPYINVSLHSHQFHSRLHSSRVAPFFQSFACCCGHATSAGIVGNR